MRSFDVVVIGGGPAGMMAAGRAGEMGASVALLERNPELGKKLLITGKGRCNFAHDEDDPLKIAEAFGKNGRFLLSSLSRFGLGEVLEFFRSRGVEPATERGKRVFPSPGQNAYTVRTALLSYLAVNRVTVMTGIRVGTLSLKDSRIVSALTGVSGGVSGDQFIVSTGGLSYPTTGSTGDGYEWARRTGHRVTSTEPSICPVEAKEPFCRELQGLSLKNVSLSLWQNGKKIEERFGEMLFTHFGISGPIVMDLSRDIAPYLKKGPVNLFLDMKPALDEVRLDARLLRDFSQLRGKEIGSCIRGLVPGAMVPIILKLAGIPENRKIDHISRDERRSIVEALKSISITPVGLLGYRWAVVTAGGVSLKDVDPKTMASRHVENLFFAGEVLDLDAPTGGFNLQACWSTGFVAGEEAGKRALTMG